MSQAYVRQGKAHANSMQKQKACSLHLFHYVTFVFLLEENKIKRGIYRQMLSKDGRVTACSEGTPNGSI